MGNPTNIFQNILSQDLATFLAVAIGDGDWSEVFEDAKVDDTARDTSDQITWVAERWANGVDDWIRTAYPAVRATLQGIAGVVAIGDTLNDGQNIEGGEDGGAVWTSDLGPAGGVGFDRISGIKAAVGESISLAWGEQLGAPTFWGAGESRNPNPSTIYLTRTSDATDYIVSRLAVVGADEGLRVRVSCWARRSDSGNDLWHFDLEKRYVGAGAGAPTLLESLVDTFSQYIDGGSGTPVCKLTAKAGGQLDLEVAGVASETWRFTFAISVMRGG